MNRLSQRFACPVELAMTILGGKWKPVILARLKEQPMRYGELRRAIPGLSDKVLTERLKDLEELGLIERPAAQAAPLYRLSAKGEALRPALSALYEWGSVEAGARGLTIG